MKIRNYESKKSGNKPRILVIDDARDILMFLEFELGEEGYHVFLAESGSHGLEILEAEDIDLVLLDIVMPNMSGLEVLEEMKYKKRFRDTSVIMLSASEQSEDIVASLDLGADDFVSKPYISEILLARIRTSLRLRKINREWEKMALTDFLTGINNRRQFYKLSEMAINKNERDSSSLIIALVDIDYFKQVNDTYGHDVGDQVLVAFATQLSKSFRGYDVVGRVGGEEFCVCLPNTDRTNGRRICERFREEISQMKIPVKVDGRMFNLNINVSIGVTCAEKESDLELLIKQADSALYSAKSEGRNRVSEYSE